MEGSFDFSDINAYDAIHGHYFEMDEYKQQQFEEKDNEYNNYE
jgi:hypothetical protein